MRAELGGRRFGKGVLVLGDYSGDGGSAMPFFFQRLRVAGWELVFPGGAAIEKGKERPGIGE